MILRLVIGVIFLYHCRVKVGDLASFYGFIGVAELAGGVAEMIGFLTQLASLGLGIIMVGAIYKKISEWHVPFSAQDKTGWEFDFMILGGCVALLLIGGGHIALDATVFGL